MNALSFVWDYVRWHYSEALIDMFYIARNYLWGVGHVFSVDILFRTLFVPWHRMGSHTAALLDDPLEYFGDVLVNIMMRVVGFFARIILLSLAFVSAFVIIVFFCILFLSWMLLPLVLTALFINACSQILL